jgi:hypothetical protein
MRLRAGLQFDAGCDTNHCANFNPSQPSAACMASCKNLFIPRPDKDESVLPPSNGECKEKTFWECLAWMDHDLGASAPIKVQLKNGSSVLVQAGKEGAVYLIDADHLGTQHDRLQIIEPCGSAKDPCKALWMGMIVTQPVVSYSEDEPIVVIPTFMPDITHPAGLVALKIGLKNGIPQLKRFWQFPQSTSRQALTAFRSHPSLPIIAPWPRTGDPLVWVVDIGVRGTLYGIRIKDGALIVAHPLLGTGRQLASPLFYNDTLYLASTLPGTNASMVEAYRLAASP